MGKMSRTKGSNFERFIAKDLSMKFYKDQDSLRRTPLSGGWSSKYVGGDICGPESFPLYVECRNREVWKASDLFDENSVLFKWYAETKQKAKELGKEGVLIFTRNYEKIYIMTRVLVDNVYPHIMIRHAHKAVCIYEFDKWLSIIELSQIMPHIEGT